MKFFQKSLLLIFALLSGCAAYQRSMPQDYAGPTALVSDSYKQLDDQSTEFYYMDSIDGRKVESALDKTRRINAGKGLHMNPYANLNPVPAKEIEINIIAETAFAAPILALTHKTYEAKGTLRFTPQKDKTYVVRGQLGANYSAVWLEQEDTGEVIGKKFELKE